MSARQSAASMAVVTLGHYDYLMPLDAATSMVKLFSKAVELQSHIDRNAEEWQCWTARGAPRLELKCIKPGQIRKSVPNLDDPED